MDYSFYVLKWLVICEFIGVKMSNDNFSNDNKVDDKEQYIWLNGEFVLWDHAKIHVLTHALHYSGSVFVCGRIWGKLGSNTVFVFI